MSCHVRVNVRGYFEGMPQEGLKEVFGKGVVKLAVTLPKDHEFAEALFKWGISLSVGDDGPGACRFENHRVDQSNLMGQTPLLHDGRAEAVDAKYLPGRRCHSQGVRQRKKHQVCIQGLVKKKKVAISDRS